MKWFLLLAGVSVALCAVAKPNKVPVKSSVKATTRDFFLNERETGGHSMVVLTSNKGSIILGHVGRKAALHEEGVTFDMEAALDEASGGWKVSVSWEGPSDKIFEDCYNFRHKEWYGGPEQKEQIWPLQKSKLEKYSMISKEDDNAAVSERYWLNSAGYYFYVHPEAPLFVDYHNVEENHICFISEVTAPYSTKRTRNVLKYDIWFFDDPKIAHQHAVDTYLGKPSGIPDYRMIQYPVWSTWARYSREIDQDLLWKFANEIVDNGYPNAQFEIDDLWEICYGSLTVDERKLPDLKQLIQDIKSLGFRVTIWVHPFINKDCDPWYSEALEKGYLVLNEEGSPDTSWWNNNGSVPGYIDFTNPEASNWYTQRVQNLIDTYGIDSLKFDAGESSWSPQVPVQDGDIDLHPGHIVAAYVRAVSQFGPMIEVRSGMRTQDLPVFIRMVDKDTYWGFNNGLATLVTTLLQMNLNGYTLVLPDMIGGNGYNDKPSKELFIRWLQANVFMPTLQYSFVPWDHDEETVEICRKFTQLHADFADAIAAAMEASVQNGTPVNAPIWWLDPTDEDALPIWDEFLLGEKILAAPVMEEGAVSRHIYLPTGLWKDGVSGESIQGPIWLMDYPAPLDTLPYFVLED
ncbi:myogenesis-regulating glycosidase-like [Ostrinia nubilalis]|uniref:myogenesis-regulating glycosidase-like n=1 Tax=Ostrinia nubilalis TaxID=29057 RepID=UPI003082450E